MQRLWKWTCLQRGSRSECLVRSVALHRPSILKFWWSSTTTATGKGVCLVAPNVALFLFRLPIASAVVYTLFHSTWMSSLLLFGFFFFFSLRLHNGDNAEIKKYFVSFWNGVDLRYKLLKGPKVRISIAGIIISRVRLPSSYNSSFFFPASFLQMVIECVHRDEMRLLTLRKIVLDATPSTRQPLWLIWESTCSKRGAYPFTTLPLL